jgi:hypothetical protein
MRVYRLQNVERCPQGHEADEALFGSGYHCCGETSTLKKEVKWSAETSAAIYVTTRRHKPEDYNPWGLNLKDVEVNLHFVLNVGTELKIVIR